jgi:hypothetical protein
VAAKFGRTARAGAFDGGDGRYIKGGTIFVRQIFSVIRPFAFTLLMLSAVAGCSESKNVESAEANATAEAPSPRYDQQDGDTYMYIGALSEDERKEGRAANVINVRYLGLEGTTQRLEVVDDYGSRQFALECSLPCKVAKQTLGDGRISRLAVPPNSIMEAAFADAFAGLLTPVMGSLPAPAETASSEGVAVKVAPHHLASADWRGKEGRCRLVVKGGTFIDGSCWIRLETDGSFQVMSLDEKYFAQLQRSGAEAQGHWNETPGSTHAHTSLGTMTRQGACWSNAEAEICAWAS